MDRLELAQENFTHSVGLAFNNLYSMMARSQKESDVFRDEMKEFKDGMGVFENKMVVLQEESQIARGEMNRKWGNLADKMGTIVEDLVLPSMPEIIRQRYGEALDFFAINVRKRRSDGTEREFDAVGIVDDLLFLNSTKSNLHARHIEKFVEEIAIFRDFFPEYRDKRIIGMLAALSVPEGLLKYAERKGFLVISIGGSLMECINSPDFHPREY